MLKIGGWTVAVTFGLCILFACVSLGRETEIRAKPGLSVWSDPGQYEFSYLEHTGGNCGSVPTEAHSIGVDGSTDIMSGCVDRPPAVSTSLVFRDTTCESDRDTTEVWNGELVRTADGISGDLRLNVFVNGTEFGCRSTYTVTSKKKP